MYCIGASTSNLAWSKFQLLQTSRWSAYQELEAKGRHVQLASLKRIAEDIQLMPPLHLTTAPSGLLQRGYVSQG